MTERQPTLPIMGGGERYVATQLHEKSLTATLKLVPKNMYIFVILTMNFSWILKFKYIIKENPFPSVIVQIVRRHNH